MNNLVKLAIAAVLAVSIPASASAIIFDLPDVLPTVKDIGPDSQSTTRARNRSTDSASIVFQLPAGFQLASERTLSLATTTAEGIANPDATFQSGDSDTTVDVAGTLTGRVGITAVDKFDDLQTRFSADAVSIAAGPPPATAWFILSALAGLFGMKGMRASA